MAEPMTPVEAATALRKMAGTDQDHGARAWRAGADALERLEVGREVINQARNVGREELDETDVAERLADAVDAWDQLQRGAR